MKKMLGAVPAVLAVVLAWSATAAAQSFDAVGTRAAAMGGAGVGVADDASAVYWNPAGLALGSYFSLVGDYRQGEIKPDLGDRAARRTSYLVALGTPSVGLSYYRLRTTSVAAVTADGLPTGTAQLDTLTTHHAGVTFVQSILPNVTIGTTLKLVRGIVATGAAPDGDRSALLDAADDLDGRGSNKGDLDIGIMARFGRLKGGVTIRDVSEPTFDSPTPDRQVRLERQARAGMSFVPLPGILVAADIDLTTPQGALGEERILAVGSEALLFPGATVRGGFHINTHSDVIDRDPTYSFGASYAIKRSFLVDAQITPGSDRTENGWGIAARFVY